jgi:hypothetical protein
MRLNRMIDPEPWWVSALWGFVIGVGMAVIGGIYLLTCAK